MARKPATNPRKSASQERSRLTVDALLEATARVLMKEGYDRASTNKIAAVAGVSIGSLYQYFPNKQALLAALHARHLDEMTARERAAIDDGEGHSLPKAVARVIRVIIASHIGKDGLHRVLAEELPESLIRVGSLALMRLLLEAYKSDLVVEDLDHAAYIVSVSIKALVHGCLRDRPDDLLSGKLETELTRFILVYLTGRG